MKEKSKSQKQTPKNKTIIASDIRKQVHKVTTGWRYCKFFVNTLR